MLSDYQKIFSKNLAKFILWIYEGEGSVTFGEVWRSPEEAKIQASKGAGIINSLHCDRLAVDLNIFNNNNELLITINDLHPYGNYWKCLHPNNKWGGDFKKKPDADHFSMSIGDGRA